VHENRPVAELLTASYTFAAAPLAKLYGMATSQTPATKVTAPEHRRGVLGHGSVLAINSSGNDTSVVRRGLWINDRVLCTKVAEPPPGVDTALPESLPATATQRERLELHRQKPECVACHTMIDPPGLALEAFDAVGRYQPTVNGKPVDTSGRLISGQTFQNAAELSALIAGDPRFASCVATHVVPIAVGRLVAPDESCAIESLLAGKTGAQLGLRDLLAGVASSPMFLTQGGAP
jgi:hypothetical protein